MTVSFLNHTGHCSMTVSFLNHTGHCSMTESFLNHTGHCSMTASFLNHIRHQVLRLHFTFKIKPLDQLNSVNSNKGTVLSMCAYGIPTVWVRNRKKIAKMNQSKGPNTGNNNRTQSSELHANLCMHGVTVLPKVVDSCFDRICSTS